MISDRRRVELAFYPALFARWMRCANEGKPSDWAVLRDLEDAKNEALAGGNLRTLLRRLKRLETIITEPLEHRQLSTCLFAFAFALRDDLEEGVLILRAGSAFDRAYEATTACLLEADGRRVIASDLLATGYGQGGVDFLHAPVPFGEDPAQVGVVTNPPFTLHYDKSTGQQVPNAVKGKASPVSGITQFALRAAALGLPVCALLHKTQFVNTGAWSSVAQQTGYRAAFVLPLGWRPDWTGDGSPTMDCAWTVWVRPDRAPAWPHTALARLPRPS